MTHNNLTAEEIIEQLQMIPHPEGGHYCETYRDKTGPSPRGHSTAIYYLLKAGEHSHWHRIDAAEVWHFYAGGPLALTISENGHDVEAFRLGVNFKVHERPQVIVPPNAWQTAESLGYWTLAGCTVAPGFDFSTFELAPINWRPKPQNHL